MCSFIQDPFRFLSEFSYRFSNAYGVLCTFQTALFNFQMRWLFLYCTFSSSSNRWHKTKTNRDHYCTFLLQRTNTLMCLERIILNLVNLAKNTVSHNLFGQDGHSQTGHRLTFRRSKLDSIAADTPCSIFASNHTSLQRKRSGQSIWKWSQTVQSPTLKNVLLHKLLFPLSILFLGFSHFSLLFPLWPFFILVYYFVVSLQVV